MAIAGVTRRGAAAALSRAAAVVVLTVPAATARSTGEAFTSDDEDAKRGLVVRFDLRSAGRHDAV